MQGWAGVGAGEGKERLKEATLKEDGQEKSQDCPSVWEKAGQAFHTPPSSPSLRGNCPNKPVSLVSPFSPHLAPKVGPQTIAPFSFQPPRAPGALLNLTLPWPKATIHTTPLGPYHHG